MTQPFATPSEALEHHGVKGMHWGVRRESAEGSSSGRPKKLSRKEVKVERAAFYQKKADHILSVASKDPNVLVALKTPNDAVIVTGKQFIDHMMSGGYMDIRMTDIWATQPSKGSQYVLNPDVNKPYVRSDGRN